MRHLYVKAMLVLCLLAFLSSVTATTPTSFDSPNAPAEEMMVIVCPNPVHIAFITGPDCEVFVNIPPPTNSDPMCDPLTITNSVNGMGDPSGVYPDTSFVITYNVMDNCGMDMTCTQIIMVLDDESPVIMAPGDTTVICSNLALPIAGNITEFVAQGGTIEDVCDLDSTSFAFVKDTLLSSDSCNKVYSRTYEVSDEAGNLAQASHMILATDTLPPTIISCPADVTASVDANMCSATVIVEPILATDDCGIASITNNITNTDDASGTYMQGNHTVTWTVTDSCGFTATCVTQVMVTDMAGPQINFPSDTLTADCDAAEQVPYSDLADFQAQGGTVTDQCGTVVSFALLDEVSDGGTCPELVTRRYIATDNAMPANTDTATQIIRVEESTPPTFDPPANVTVDCDADLNDVAIVGDISNYSDNCAGSPADVSFTDAIAQGSCPGESIITRTYMVLDSCGNLAVGNQTITTQDMSPPTVSCQDVTIYLDETGEAVLDPSDFDDGTSTDNCSNDLIWTIGIGTTFACNQVSPPPAMLTVSVDDGCGNIATCMANLLILDTLTPQLFCPGPDSLDCTEDLPAAFSSWPDFVAGGGDWDDNCEGLSDPIAFDLLEETVPTTFTCPYDITRTYQVTDLSGNTATCTHVFTIVDSLPPVFAFHADIIIDGVQNDCDTMLNLSSAVVNDNCNNNDIFLFNDYTGTDNPSASYPIGTTTVTWYASDACGNIDSLKYDVIVNADPMFMCPADITADCSLDGVPPYADFSEFEAAGGMYTMVCMLDESTFRLVSEDTTSATPCDTTIVRTYGISGGGNEFTCTQMVQVSDNEAPTTNNTSSLVLGTVSFGTCMADIGPITLAASDNCGSVTVVNDFNNTAILEGSFMLDTTVVTWTVTDACGNVTLDTTTVVIGDNESPVLNCPTPPVALCDISEIDTISSFAQFQALGGTATDNCMVDTASFTFVEDITFMMFGMTFHERVYQIADLNGNIATCTQFLLMNDVLPPSILCPANITVDVSTGCDTMLTLPLATASDSCGSVIITNSRTSGGADASDVYPVGSTTVEFTATDEAGLTAQCTMVVTVTDNGAPLISCPADMTVECDTALVPIYLDSMAFVDAGGSFNDACGAMILDYVGSSYTPGACTKTVVRTYRATDIHGNSMTCDQTISATDTQNPTIQSCPLSPIIQDAAANECGATITIDTSGMNISDNCGIASVTNSYNTGGADATDFFAIGDTMVTFTVTDSCGLTASCTVMITVNDITNPTLTCPDVDTTACSVADVPVLDVEDFFAAGGTFQDACDLDSMSLTMAQSETTPTTVTPACLRTYQRTYTLSDVNGLMGSCTQDIVVLDTIKPTLQAIADTTIYLTADTCEALLLLPIPVVDDNCGIDSVGNSLAAALDSVHTFQVDTTEITWYAIDSCGNEDSTTYHVIVLDTIAPIVVQPDTSMAQCNPTEIDTIYTLADLDSFGGMASDKCGIDSIRLDSVIAGPFPNTVNRIYTVVDIHGNESMISHIIRTMDTQDPTFVVPADTIIDCTASLDPLDFDMPTDVADNCVVMDTFITMTQTSFGPCDATYMRTIRIVDAAGREAIQSHTVTVQDTFAPVFTTIPTLSDIACGEAFPSGLEPTFTDVCDAAPVLTVDTIFTPDVCSGYEVVVRYTLTDQCSNVTVDSATFQVLADTLDPVITSFVDTIRLNTGVDSCSKTFALPAPTADDCTGVSITNDYGSNEFFLDTTRVEWRITDQCGNADTVLQVVIVEDNQEPTILCDPRTVVINQEPLNLVDADSFIATMTDNCTKEAGLIVEAMRVDASGNGLGACNDSGNAIFRDSISFCCEDIGQTVQVMVRVTDLRGNATTCTTEATVQDNLPPSISSATTLPNILLSCEYPLDTADLSGFGKWVFDINDRDSILIDDFYYQANNNFAGYDGFVLDNCPDNTTIEESLLYNLNTCGQGTLTRVFTIDDGFNAPVQATQTITVKDISPIVLADIEFPADYFHHDCSNPALDPSISGEPTVENMNKCSDIWVHSSDLVFDQVFSGCPTVQRTWTVIDWCQYETNNPTGPGKWEMTQMIKVIDTIAPELDVIADTIICAVLDECDAMVILSAAASDTCTDPDDLNYSYRADTDGDGTYDQTGVGSTFSRRMDFGLYSIEWTVNDGCGNSDVAVTTFEVRDCKPPQAVCLNGLSISLSTSGEAELWASDINQYSSDNCTASGDLKLSFSSDVTEIGRVFTCDSLGQRIVELWVTDEAGNQSYCITTIEVQDNNDPALCPNSLVVADVGGQITLGDGTPLPGTILHLEGPELEKDLVTDSLGHYMFDDLFTTFDYSIQPINDTDHDRGVTTLDLVLIQRHILGISRFDQATSMIAADVDNNERISGSDIVRLRKLILGVTDRFEDNTSYRFVNDTYVFEEETDPWPFQEEWIMQNLSANYMHTDFTAIKVGDVNGSATDLEGRSAKGVGLYVQDQRLEAGTEVSIPIMVKDWLQISAAQWTIDVDPADMEILEVSSDYLSNVDQALAIAEDHARLAWFDAKTSTVGDNEVLMTIKAKVNKTALLSDVFDINGSELVHVAYGRGDQPKSIAFEILDVAESAVTLYQNSPNPFTDFTSISFDLAKAGNVRIELRDAGGKLISAHQGDYTAGTHNYNVSSRDVDPNVGVILYSITTDGKTITKKMLRLE